MIRTFPVCILCCVCLMFASCTPQTPDFDPIAAPTGLPSEKVYIALGDSICRGCRLNDPARERYSALVAEELGYTVYNYGVDGMDGEGLLAFLQSGNVKNLSEATLITVSIGGNTLLGVAKPTLDSLLSFGTGTLSMERVYASMERETEAFAVQLEGIVGFLCENAPEATVVLQTVYNPYASFKKPTVSLGDGKTLTLASFVDDCVRKLNAVIISQTERERVLLCDVYSVFSVSPERPTNASAFGLVFDPHPNAYGHRLIASEVVKVVG